MEYTSLKQLRGNKLKENDTILIGNNRYTVTKHYFNYRSFEDYLYTLSKVYNIDMFHILADVKNRKSRKIYTHFTNYTQATNIMLVIFAIIEGKGIHINDKFYSIKRYPAISFRIGNGIKATIGDRCYFAYGFNQYDISKPQMSRYLDRIAALPEMREYSSSSVSIQNKHRVVLNYWGARFKIGCQEFGMNSVKRLKKLVNE